MVVTFWRTLDLGESGLKFRWWDYSSLTRCSLLSIHITSVCSIQGVLTLKNSYLEPRYVLVLPVNECALERRLLEKGCYNDLQIKDILTRSEMYAEYNRTHPGFFDVAISSGKVEFLQNYSLRSRWQLLCYLLFFGSSTIPEGVRNE